MADDGYWGRLAQEPIEPSEDDHPLGFRQGTVQNAVLPRLAVLLSTLTTEEQRSAFSLLCRDLSWYCRQTHHVLGRLRSMARTLEGVEDRQRQCFDEEAYKRASVTQQDLFEVWTLRHVDWGSQAVIGRGLNQQLEEAKARKEEESREKAAAWWKEHQEKREAYLLKRIGVLYKTGPGDLDGSIPSNVRQDMPAAEAQLVNLGFEVRVEGNVRCCTRRHDDVVIYGDIRGASIFRFNVFRGSRLVTSFWLKDGLGDLQRKFEAKVGKVLVESSGGQVARAADGELKSWPGEK